DEIQFTVPDDPGVGEGCYVPISIKVAGVASNLVTLPKADSADLCVHPLGLSADALRKLDNGDRLFAGIFNLNTSIYDSRSGGQTQGAKVEAANAEFSLLSQADLYTLGANDYAPIGNRPGECSVSTGLTDGNGLGSAQDTFSSILYGDPLIQTVTLDSGNT